MAKTVIGLEVNMNSSGAEGSVKSLKQQLREAQAEVAAMSDKFGLTSEQAQKAAQKAAQLKDAIGDAKTLTDAFNPDAKFKSFSNAISGVVGGFSALQGAQALFGDQSEELTKTLAKVQGAMALSQGINSILEAQDAFKILGSIIKTNVVAAFSTLKGAIISTGIGALIVAVGLLVNELMNMSDAADEAAEAIVGVLAKTIATTDTDYASDRLVPVEVPVEKHVEWLADGTGTFAATDIGTEFGISDSGTVDKSETTADAFKMTGFVNTAKIIGYLKINGSY